MASKLLNLFRIKTHNSSEVFGISGWPFVDPPYYMPAFEFEKKLNHQYWTNLVSGNWSIVFYIAALYLGTIFGLREYMKTRPAFNLRTPLFYWNAGLGIFSIIGFTRMAPAFFRVLLGPDGLYRIICLRDGIDDMTAFWYLAFGLSKFVELGDTVFIVLRKKPLIFLHWFHHAATMIIMWIIGIYCEPINRIYALMNYGVHSLMYPYFALKAKNINIPNKISNCITTLQLLQMIVGLFLNFYTVYLFNSGMSCARHPFSVKLCGMVYASFTVLFGKLFYNSVVASKKEKQTKSKVKVSKIE